MTRLLQAMINSDFTLGRPAGAGKRSRDESLVSAYYFDGAQRFVESSLGAVVGACEGGEAGSCETLYAVSGMCGPAIVGC